MFSSNRGYYIVKVIHTYPTTFLHLIYSTVLQSLRSILHGPYGETKRLTLLRELETQHANGSRGNILSQLSKMVPLTNTLVGLRRLMMLFLRRVIELLDEMQILKNKELAQEILHHVRQFWSLCFNQQAVVVPLQICGQWEPVLLEVVTSLACIYIDLFLVAHHHAENPTTLSKRLYCWLAFDLNQRALKTALLDVSCPAKKASRLLSPVLNSVLSKQLEGQTPLDYLLHMLLVKKWCNGCIDADLIETTRNMKAPKKFIPWLSERWKDSHSYIPLDKSLKGRRVTHFLMDLDKEAVESLTDMFCECLKEKEDVNITNGPHQEAGEEGLSSSLFVLDKKGSGPSVGDIEMLPEQLAQDEGGDESVPSSNSVDLDDLFILDKKGSGCPLEVPVTDLNSGDAKPRKQKRKRENAEPSPTVITFAEEADCFVVPDQTSESSPVKKRRKVKAGYATKKALDFTEISNKSPERKEFAFRILDDEETAFIVDDDDVNGDEEDNPLGLTESDFEELQELHNQEEEEIDGGGSDVDVVKTDNKGKKGKRRVKEQKGNSVERLVISDPVSSYFTTPKNVDGKISVCDLTGETEEDNAVVFVGETGSSSMNPLSSKSSEGQSDGIGRTSSLRKKRSLTLAGQGKGYEYENSPQQNTIVLHEDSSDEDGEISFTVDTNINEEIKQSTEEEISRQLSNIRKSVSQSSEKRTRSRASESEISTPSKISTRLRTKSGGEELTTTITTPRAWRGLLTQKTLKDEKMNTEPSSMVCTLKEWLRSPPVKKLPKEVKSPTSPAKLADNHLDLGMGNSGSSLQATGEIVASSDENKRIAESPVRGKVADSLESSLKKSSAKAKLPLTHLNVFPRTYEGLARKSISKQTSTPLSGQASSQPIESASGDHSVLTDSDQYNLRTPKKSSSVKALDRNLSPTIDSYFPSLGTSTLHTGNKLQTPTRSGKKEKINKSDASIVESLERTPKTPARKPLQTPKKSSGKKSPNNIRQSLRSARKADSPKAS